MEKYVFTDDNGERFEIDANDAQEALLLDEFYHPLTGYRVYKFREALVKINDNANKV